MDLLNGMEKLNDKNAFRYSCLTENKSTDILDISKASNEGMFGTFVGHVQIKLRAILFYFKMMVVGTKNN